MTYDMTLSDKILLYTSKTILDYYEQKLCFMIIYSWMRTGSGKPVLIFGV